MRMGEGRVLVGNFWCGWRRRDIHAGFWWVSFGADGGGQGFGGYLLVRMGEGRVLVGNDEGNYHLQQMRTGGRVI